MYASEPGDSVPFCLAGVSSEISIGPVSGLSGRKIALKSVEMIVLQRRKGSKKLWDKGTRFQFSILVP